VPLRQLAANAGLDPAVAVRGVQSAPAGFGLDLESGTIVDLRARGVIDATDVVRVAVQSAVSIARTALLAEVIVAQRPLPRQPKRPYGHHHGHDHGHFGGVDPAHDHGHAHLGHVHEPALESAV
jgi:chaperonin GroEL